MTGGDWFQPKTRKSKMPDMDCLTMHEHDLCPPYAERDALLKRVAELEGLLGEAWPFLTRYPALECLSQRIERALAPKDGD